MVAKKQKPKSVKEIIQGARLPEQTIPMCLRGDLAARHERAAAALADAMSTPATSMAGSGITAAQAELDAIREEMAGSTVDFVVRAMDGRKWQKFTEKHPPRTEDGKVVLDDRAFGVNLITFTPALIMSSVVEPELDDEDWARLLGTEEQAGVLTTRQIQVLFNLSWNANKDFVVVPFSPAVSKTSPS